MIFKGENSNMPTHTSSHAKNINLQLKSIQLIFHLFSNMYKSTYTKIRYKIGLLLLHVAFKDVFT